MKKFKISIIFMMLYVALFATSLTVQTSNGDVTIDLNEIENIEIVQYEMTFVEGGMFIMGDHYNEGWDDELPVHSVTLDDFYIGKYEVTHAEFIEFLNNIGAEVNGSYNGNQLIDIENERCPIEHDGNNFNFVSNSYVSSADCPVIEITWVGACEYSNWLSDFENLTECYNISIGYVECDFEANGYRLPTEAEWEYACRGGINWIDDFRYSGCHELSDLTDYAWYNNNSSDLHPTGEKLPNQLGLFDMSGNVYELCWDWFSSSYYSNSPSTNPTGPDTGSDRVSRGGDWNDGAAFVRSAARFSSYPHTSNGYLGFRIIRANP